MPKISLVLACTLLFSVGGFAAEKPYRPNRLLAPQPPIKNPETRTTGDIGDQLADTELVLGVTVGGESRAYPINMLTGPSREIINDTLGEQAIAATW